MHVRCTESVLSGLDWLHPHNVVMILNQGRWRETAPGLLAVSRCWRAGVSVDQNRFNVLLLDSFWRKQCFKVTGCGINSARRVGLKTSLLFGRPEFWTSADCSISQATPASGADTILKSQPGSDRRHQIINADKCEQVLLCETQNERMQQRPADDKASH